MNRPEQPGRPLPPPAIEPSRFGSRESAAPQRTPPSLVDIRRHNLAGILQAIRAGAPVTRADLIAISGLNRVTVFDIVAELQAVGLVQESGSRSTGKSGRPSRVLELDDSRLAVGAVEINIGRLSIRCSTLQGRTLMSRLVDYSSDDLSPARVLQKASEAITQAHEALAAQGIRLVRVSLGCPAFVQHANGLVIKSRGLDWENVAVVDELQRRIPPNIVLTLDRLANLAINAERRAGGWDPSAGVLVLYGDVGVGGAFQKNAELLRGDSGVGAEFGHLTVNFDGPRCYCGRFGCLETYVGIGPLAAALDMAWEGSLSPSTVESILMRVAARDERARQELEKQGIWLARAASVLSTIFDPKIIILSGYLPQLAPEMMPSFRAEMRRLRGAEEAASPTEIQISNLGLDAVLAGGIEAAIAGLVQSPWSLPTQI